MVRDLHIMRFKIRLVLSEIRGIFSATTPAFSHTMKIALIRKEYTLRWGGAESYVVNLARL